MYDLEQTWFEWPLDKYYVMSSSGEAIKTVTESTGMSGNLDTSSSLHFSSRIDEYPRKLTVVELFVLILFYFGYVKFGFPAVWSRTFFDLESAAADTNQDMRRCDRTRKKTTAKACKKYDKKLYLILRHESLDISYLFGGWLHIQFLYMETPRSIINFRIREFGSLFCTYTDTRPRA